MERRLIFKIVEVVLALIILITHIADHYHGNGVVTHGTFLGFFIIILGMVGGLAFGKPMNDELHMYFTVVGCIMYMTAGAFVVDAWNIAARDRFVGFFKGLLAICTGIIKFIELMMDLFA